VSESNYVPNGMLQGDTKGMPDRGTSTGLTGEDPQLDGASIDGEATNRIGSITGATGSDPADECKSDDQAFGGGRPA
jgi:hypothetical protein